MKRYLPFIIIAVVFLSAAARLFYSKQRALKAEAVKTAVGKPGAEPPHVRGSAKARVTLEEFGDFECTPCGIFSSVLEQIEKDYGERLRVIFREFPLVMHKHALGAARAAMPCPNFDFTGEISKLFMELSTFYVFTKANTR